MGVRAPSRFAWNVGRVEAKVPKENTHGLTEFWKLFLKKILSSSSSFLPSCFFLFFYCYYYWCCRCRSVASFYVYWVFYRVFFPLFSFVFGFGTKLPSFFFSDFLCNKKKITVSSIGLDLLFFVKSWVREPQFYRVLPSFTEFYRVLSFIFHYPSNRALLAFLG